MQAGVEAQVVALVGVLDDGGPKDFSVAGDVHSGRHKPEVRRGIRGRKANAVVVEIEGELRPRLQPAVQAPT